MYLKNFKSIDTWILFSILQTQNIIWFEPKNSTRALIDSVYRPGLWDKSDFHKISIGWEF